MKKVISLILLLSILLSTFAGIGVTANAIGNYGVNIDSAAYTSNDNPFTRRGYWGQCTWYCWGRAKEKGTTLWWGSNDSYGNAMDWYKNATNYYTCDQTPSANSILVSSDGWTDDGYRVGHVMFVEKVENGYAYITEANYWGAGAVSIFWNGQSGRYHEDVISLSNSCRNGGKGSHVNITGYIHIGCIEHKWNKGTITTKATCTSNGVKTYTCTVCGETKTETIKGGHKYKVIGRVRATFLVNGAVGRECTVCGNRVKTVVYRPKSVVSNKSRVTYNSKYQYPGVTVKDIKGNVISSKYYTVSYEKNKYVGFGKITVKFKGLYSGSKTVAFMIAPKGTSLKSAKGASTSSIKVYWNKQTKQTSGYQIQYSTNSKFAKNNKSFNTKNYVTGRKVTKLKAGTTYYFRIRTYKTINKKPFYSGWSKVKSAKTTAPPPTWVKPLNYSWSYHGHNLFAISEKYGKYYCYIDRDWPYYNSGDPSEYCYLYKYTSASADPQKIYLAKNDDDNITSALTDGNGNVYYAQWQFDDGYGTVYRITDNGETSKIFTAKNLAKITGIYGGYIYYIKEIFKSHELADVHFCKYNLKTKKSSTIKKKAWNLYTNTDTRGRYMLFQGFTQSILDTSVTLFDAKTGKAYKITSKGREAHFSGGKIYYSSGWNGQNKNSKIIRCTLTGKNKKTISQINGKYVPLCTSSKCMYFYKNLGGGHNNYDFYAYIFKTKKFVKIDPYRNYIVDIQ